MPKKPSLNKSEIDFMLAEYARLVQLEIDENKHIENRVTYFLTLTSVAGGALAFISELKTLSEDAYQVPSIILLLILLTLGFNTLNRMNARKSQMKIYRDAQRRIREYLSKYSPHIREYNERLQNDFENQVLRFRTRLARFIAQRMRGSLTDLIITVNALILGGLAWVTLSYFNSTVKVMIIGIALTVGIGLALMYIYHEILSDKLPPFGM